MRDSKTSPTLISQLQNQGTEEDWARFCSEYTAYIHAIARSYDLSESDSEEITQDVLVKVWKALPRFLYDRNRCKFRTWLGTI